MNLQSDNASISISCIYDIYEKNMREQAYHILQNTEEAELIVQESLLKIIGYLDLFDLRAIKNRRSRHFFMTIVKQTAIDYYRKKQNKLHS